MGLVILYSQCTEFGELVAENLAEFGQRQSKSQQGLHLWLAGTPAAMDRICVMSLMTTQHNRLKPVPRTLTGPRACVNKKACTLGGRLCRTSLKGKRRPHTLRLRFRLVLAWKIGGYSIS
jgi:hypothetical protein